MDRKKALDQLRIMQAWHEDFGNGPCPDYDAICYAIGMFISGIVSFLVCSCIVAEERSDKQKVWADGYTAGYTDGVKGEVSAI